MSGGMVAVASLKGAPGVTTLALALVAGWPAARRPLLVEADPAGGDLLSWRDLDQEAGVLSWATAARQEGPSTPVRGHAQRLAEGSWVIPAPVDGGQTRAALGVLVSSGALAAHAGAGRPLVLDVGRVPVGTGNGPLPPGVDLVAVLTRPAAPDLARLAAARDTLRAGGRVEAGVVLVGDPPWPADQIAEAVGLPVWGMLPDDPRGATTVRVGHRRAARTGLARAARTLAGELARQLEARPASAGRLASRPAPRPLPAPASRPLDPAGGGAPAELGGWTPRLAGSSAGAGGRPVPLAAAPPPPVLPPSETPRALPPGASPVPPAPPTPDSLVPAGWVTADGQPPSVDGPEGGDTGGWRRPG